MGRSLRASLSAVVAGAVRPASACVLALGLAVILALAGPALAAVKATIAGSEMSGFGRIVLSFDSLPKASVRQSGGILVLSFDQPVKLPVEKLATEMPNYVGVLRVDPDGRAIRIGLARPFRPNIMEAGEQLFLDLLPEGWKGLPPGLPQEVVDALSRRMKQAEEEARKAVAKRAEESERAMTFSVGQLPTLRRLSFELPRMAEITAHQNGTRFEMLFEAPFRVDENRLRTELGPSVTNLSAEAGDGALRLAFDLPDGVEARGFREDDSYVVDIPSPKPAKVERASPETLPARPGKGKAAEPAKAAQATDARRGPEARAEGRAGEPKLAAEPQGPREAEPPRAPVSAAREAAAASAAPPPPAATDPPARPPEPPAALPGDGRITVSGGRDGLHLQLPLPTRTPVAVFERGGVLWIAAETPLALDLPQPADPDLLGRPEQRRSGPLSILRLPLGRPALVRAAPADRGWLITLGDDVVAPTEAIALRRGSDKDGRTVVTAALPGVSGVFWVDDPDIGDRFAIVTARAPARGLVKAQGFVDFRALTTAHGLAVVPQADDVAVRLGIDEVAVSRDGGLSVSVLAAEPVTQGEGSGELELAIDRDLWAGNRVGNPRLRMRELFDKAAAAGRSRRGEARLALGRLQLAIGLATEAGATFDAAVMDDPSLAASRSVLLLRAAAQALAGRFAEAAAILGDPALKDDPEALLWRGAVEANERHWGPALLAFRQAGPVLDRYPEDLQGRMRLLAAEAALQTRDFGFAQQLLDALDSLAPEDRDHDRLELLRARLAEGQGRSDEALPVYRELAQKAARPVAAEARLHAATAGLKEGAIDRQAAIAELETVAVAWRGDDLEASTLGVLGRLYAEEGRWREAFSVARTANQLYPDNESARSLYEDAGSRFEALFLDGKADSIPRVDALALYFDFKDFTPVGRRGDELIRRLSERLVELDLLSEASDLLQYQVDNRLTGAAKASVAGRLAIIYLMNRQPARALQVLQDSRMAQLPAELRRARGLLEARAMADMSRTDLALETITDETGPDVERLRADILWQGHRWREAGETFERIVGDAWQQAGPLDDAARADVMRAAIAYGLGEERLSLERLRAKFAGKMSDSTDARSFALVTSPSSAKPGEYRDIAKAVANADTFGEFLAEFRKRHPAMAPGERKPAAPPAAPEPKPAEAKPAEAAAKPGPEPKPAADDKSGHEAKPAAHKAGPGEARAAPAGKTAQAVAPPRSWPKRPPSPPPARPGTRLAATAP
jgi:tetratricopeptide (TPR) repeat protein